MYIGSRVTPKRTKLPYRAVSVLGQEYLFRDLMGDGHFICEITNEAHINRLLTGEAKASFYEYKGKVPLTRTAAPSAPAPDPALLGAKTDGTDTTLTPAEIEAAAKAQREQEELDAKGPPVVLADFSTEIQDEAAALLDGDGKVIKNGIGKVSAPVVLVAAQQLEAKRKDGPRKFVMDLLNTAIEAIKATGGSLDQAP